MAIFSICVDGLEVLVLGTGTLTFLELAKQNQIRPLVAVEHDRPVEEAVKLMLAGDFDQLPVHKKKKLVGVVSHRSIAKALSGISANGVGMKRLTVRDFMEPLPRLFTVEDPLGEVLDALSLNGYILVQSNREICMVTACDALQTFKQIVS